MIRDFDLIRKILLEVESAPAGVSPIPVECGSQDKPSNMQWQTIAEGKEKDKWERKGCKTSSVKGFIANTQVLNLTHRLTS